MDIDITFRPAQPDSSLLVRLAFNRQTRRNLLRSTNILPIRVWCLSYTWHFGLALRHRQLGAWTPSGAEWREGAMNLPGPTEDNAWSSRRSAREIGGGEALIA